MILLTYLENFLAGSMGTGSVWGDSEVHYSPSSGAGYARSNRWQQIVAFTAVGGYSQPAINLYTIMLRAHQAVHPNMADSGWCSANLPEGLAYAGIYYAATVQGPKILSETQYDCPHCALKESRRILTERGQLSRGISCMISDPASAIPVEYIQASGLLEVAGETRAMDTSTLKDYVATSERVCSNCGRMGHNRASCEHVARHFDKIGVEVEGRFNNVRAMQNIAGDFGATYSGDGSIHESPDSDASCYEFKTKPGNLRETIEQVVAMYPDESDASCGMHIHMSFPQDCLTLLNTAEFFAYFSARWRKWGAEMGLHPDSEFFKRLRGDNDYCQRNETPRRLMWQGERYEQLNFTAWAGHKTVECRLLPMFRRSSLAAAAIRELVAIYEDFLACPEAHGLTWDDFVRAGADISFLAPHRLILDTIALDVPVWREFTGSCEMELAELAPPAENMVRIALPVNQAITIEALAARLTALRVA